MAESAETESGPESEKGPEAVSAAAAMAIGMRKARAKPTADPVFDDFLRDQQRLINLQSEHLHEQRELVLSRLRWGRFGDRLRVLFQVLSILVGLVVATGLGALAWNAAQDHAIVIDGFSVPADLAQQGSTGEALATELHDKLVGLRSQTVTGNVGFDVRGKAVSDSRVAIPETGVSIAEANQFLHDWLGHERRVTGEVVRIASGPDKGALTINLRVDGEPGARLVQRDCDLEALLQKAAEHVYGVVDPINFDNWLNQHGRLTEALALAREMTTRANRADRAWGYFAQSCLNSGRLPLAQSRDLLAESVAQDGGDYALNNLAVADTALGRSELALSEFRRAQSRPVIGVTPQAAAEGRLLVAANIGSLIGDYRAELQWVCLEFRSMRCDPRGLTEAVISAAPTSATDEIIALRPYALASGLAWLHDTNDAARILAMPRPATLRSGNTGQADFESARLGATIDLHLAREDWAGLENDVRQADALGRLHQ